MSVQKDKVFTDELTNDSITITAEMGVTKVSVGWKSGAAGGTVIGSYELGGRPSTALAVTEDNPVVTVTANDNSATVIDGYTITAPSGVVLQVIALL